MRPLGDYTVAPDRQGPNSVKEIATPPEVKEWHTSVIPPNIMQERPAIVRVWPFLEIPPLGESSGHATIVPTSEHHWETTRSRNSAYLPRGNSPSHFNSFHSATPIAGAIAAPAQPLWCARP